MCEMEIMLPVRSEVAVINEVLSEWSFTPDKMELLMGKFSFK